LVFLQLLLASLAFAKPTTIKHLVTFGDSYTDQSRLSFFFGNNSFPPKHYQEVYPPGAEAADGGASWVRYAKIYGNVKSFNYATSGAACSNFLTGRPGLGPPAYPEANFPSVIEYEIPAFVQDHITNHTKGKTTTFTSDLDPATAVFTLWIGTNDVGFGSLLTGNQTAGVTIVDVIDCTIDWMKSMYTFGARNFVFQNMIPLQQTPLYSPHPFPLTRYWPFPHNMTQYAIEMSELVAAGNRLWDLQVPAEIAKLPGAKGALFSSFDLFNDMFHNPAEFLNGTHPLNVTGVVAQSNITGGDTVLAPNPDSFLWFDALHPSEQASRIVAREITKTITGAGSKYATFLNGKKSF